MKNYLAPGMKIIFGGRQCAVDGKINGEIQLRDLITHELIGFAEADLFAKFLSGEARIAPRNDSATIEAMELIDSIALSNEQGQKAVEFRLKFVLPIERSGVTLGNNAEITKLGQVVADELQVKRPSNSSLKRWVKAYRLSGGDPRSLLPKHRVGNTRRKFGIRPAQIAAGKNYVIAQEVYDVVISVINEFYMKTERLSVSAVHNYLLRRIQNLNRHRSEENRLPYPTLSSLYRIVSELDPYERDCARYGKRIAAQRHQQYGMGPRPVRPLERAEGDHTRLPLMVVDFLRRLPVGRPWLTTLIDKFSGAILGFYLAFEPPGANSIMKCLEHAIQPKDFIGELYPNIQNKWDCWGIPETMAVDNGMEFLSGHYERTCLELGIRIDFSPVRKPWYKSTVENHFGVINKQLLSHIPGKTFANIFEKDEYDPVENAVVSFEACLELIYIWIVDVYNQSIRRGYEQTGPKNIPAVTWREGIEKFPQAIPTGINLNTALRMVESRTLTSSGIELFGIRYNDAALSAIRQGKSAEVFVKYDSSDLGLIYVADTVGKTYIPVPAINQQYASGLSKHQNKILRRYLRDHLRSEINQESLIEAKARIQDIVDQEMRSTKKIKSLSSIARWNKLNSKTTDERRRKAQLEEELYNPNQTPPLALPPAVFDYSSNPEIESAEIIKADGLTGVAGAAESEATLKPKNKAKAKSKAKHRITLAKSETEIKNLSETQVYEPETFDAANQENAYDALDTDDWEVDFGLLEGDK